VPTTTFHAYNRAGYFGHQVLSLPLVARFLLQVEVLAEYQLRPEESAAQNGRSSVAVAVRQGPLLATAFHPELTKDLRW
jgi:glutamine amidotransferase PdxT